MKLGFLLSITKKQEGNIWDKQFIYSYESVIIKLGWKPIVYSMIWYFVSFLWQYLRLVSPNPPKEQN